VDHAEQAAKANPVAAKATVGVAVAAVTG